MIVHIDSKVEKPEWVKRLLPVSVIVVAVALVMLAFDVWSLLLAPRATSLERTREMVVALSGQEDKPPIILFTAKWCGVCRAAEAFLAKYNINHVNADIENNELAHNFYRELTGGYYSGVPLVIVGDEVIKGYKPMQTLQAVNRLAKD